MYEERHLLLFALPLQKLKKKLRLRVAHYLLPYFCRIQIWHYICSCSIPHKRMQKGGKKRRTAKNHCPQKNAKSLEPQWK